jgi:hypothetical protein
MASVTLNTRYRPARIGFCIRQNDLASAILATDVAHTIWGGRFCPIIPCDDATYASRLIAVFGVDALYAIRKDHVIDAVISNHKLLAWPTFDRDFYVANHHGPVPQFLSVTHPIRILRRRRKDIVGYPTIVHFEWEQDDVLAPWLCALVGRYPDIDTSRQFYKEFESLSPKQFRLRKDADLPEGLMHQITPNSITAIDLQLGRLREKGIYIASGDTFFDIVTFWNLRATGEKIAFYDRAAADRLERFLSRFRGFDNELRPADDSPPLRLYAKDDLSLHDTQFSGSSFTRTEYFLTNFVFALPRFGTWSRSILASIDSSHPPAIDFSLPEKPWLEDIEFHHEHLVLEVTSYRNVISQPDYMFPPPSVAALNDFYWRQLWYDPNAVRAMPRGLDFFIRATAENFQTRGIGTYDVIQQLFNLAGIQVQRSRPGLIARQLIQQMGDLQACRVFKIPGVRSLIEKYGPTESFVRSEAIQMIRELDFAAHASLYIEKRSHQSLTPDDVFAFLLDKEVFRAGLKLECPNCQLSFWKHIDDCITRLPCEYCGKVFNITPQLKHRGDWRFRRSGLFGASNHQEGSIPVVLTLQQIEANIHDYPLSYTTSLKLDSIGVDCETDFVVIHSGYDGTVEIVVSECKTSDEISQRDIDNLSAVADRLSALDLKVFLLFSKTSAFTEEEIDRCKAIRPRVSGGTILLSVRELEPYSIYERASKEFHVEAHGGSFEDMMEATRLIYLEPRGRT